jgi:hypothetical protein
MDYKEYQKVYKKLLSDAGLQSLESEVGEKEKVLRQINEFLGKYPTLLPKDKNPATPLFELSIREVYRRTLQASIDIIHEVSDLITQKNYMTQTTFRRKMFEVVTKKERRLYVGIWLVFLSFVLYFIDSAA